LAFSYYAVFNAATKIDFTGFVIARGKTDRKTLFRPQWL
jgi:hypothetical protein